MTYWKKAGMSDIKLTPIGWANVYQEIRELHTMIEAMVGDTADLELIQRVALAQSPPHTYGQVLANTVDVMLSGVMPEMGMSFDPIRYHTLLALRSMQTGRLAYVAS